MIQLINLFDFVHQKVSPYGNNCKLDLNKPNESKFCREAFKCDTCPFYRNNQPFISDTLEKVITNHGK
jgi:hypothetical protein